MLAASRHHPGVGQKQHDQILGHEVVAEATGLLRTGISERHRRWPSSSNPYLLVSRRTAMHSDNPPIVRFAVRYQFRFTGLNPQRIWTDRILDEARDTADPIHLMRVFGLSATTAVKYVQAAHPTGAPSIPSRRRGPQRLAIDGIQPGALLGSTGLTAGQGFGQTADLLSGARRGSLHPGMIAAAAAPTGIVIAGHCR